MAKTSKF